jgi:hypothetical protein
MTGKSSASVWTGLAASAAILAGALPLHAAEPRGPTIYSCIDDKGRRLTADRPIPECNSREQRVHNRDGSVRDVRQPTPTAEERADAEARERKAAELRLAQAEAVRRDRNLMIRFRSEEAHGNARAAALDTVKLAIKASEQRLKELAIERRPLLNESEFYKGKAIPAKLRAQLDANDVATDAQRAAMGNQEAELVRVNRLYDTELERLKKLWGGTRPGSMGPNPQASGTPAVATTR